MRDCPAAEGATMIAMPKRPRDPNQFAKLIVDMATGNAPKDPPESARAKSGRKGGKKGGKARAAKLTVEERADIARKAAAKRWAK